MEGGGRFKHVRDRREKRRTASHVTSDIFTSVSSPLSSPHTGEASQAVFGLSRAASTTTTLLLLLLLRWSSEGGNVHRILKDVHVPPWICFCSDRSRPRWVEELVQ